MTTLVLSLILGFSFLFNIVLVILVKIQIKKINEYEQWFVFIRNKISNSLNEMREIDKRGTFATSMNDKGLFESDDEVGIIFRDMMEVLENLEQESQ